MKKILRAHRFINVLSLDVAAGAVICASFFSKIFGVVIWPHGFICLGLTVWIIYTLDHLLDAKKLTQDASTERHRFHQQNFKALSWVVILAVMVDITQIYFIRSIVFFAGLWLSILVGVYFLVQQRLGFLKEFLGAVLYTGGVLLIPVSVKTQVSTALVLLILQFGITAWINLLLFSWIDQMRDQRDTHRSFATVFGGLATQRMLIFLFALNGVMTLAQFYLFPTGTLAILTLLSMNLLLLLIFIKKNFFEKEDRYRLLGDAVFLLPLIYIVL